MSDGATRARSVVDLGPLFDVQTVAVVGASPGKHYSTSVINNLIAYGIADTAIWRVNPRYDAVDDAPCYGALGDLPGRPSLVVSLLGWQSIDGVLDEVIALGIPALMVIADGFAEAGEEGISRQQSLAAKAREHGVVLLGPNSLGFASPRHHVAAWVGGQIPSDLRVGNVALAFQSSGILNLVISQVGARRIGISGAISVGNEAVVDLSDCIRHFTADEHTSVLGIVIESTTRPRDLASSLLEARRAGKVLVVLSIGKSERGMLNVTSHAGRMATSGKVWDALFRQVGAVVVDEIADFLDTVALASRLPAAAFGGGLALATISGGETGMLSDVAEALDLRLAAVTDETQATLDEALNRTAILANPLDVRNTRTSAPDVFTTCISTLAADPLVDVVALRLNLSAEPTAALVRAYTEVTSLVRESGAACVFMARANEAGAPGWYALRLARRAVPQQLRGSAAGLRPPAAQRRRRRPGGHRRELPGVPLVIEEAGESEALSWHDTQAWLADWKIPYVSASYAEDVAAAVGQAAATGYPVALKGVLPGLAHKTEHDLVALGVGDDDEAARVSEALLARMAAARGDDSEVPGLEIQAMAAGGAECFVGVHRDPILGPILSFGLGGIYLEIFQDVAHAVPPVSPSRSRPCCAG